MKRAEIIKKMSDVEIKQSVFKRMRMEMRNHYFNKIIISGVVMTRNFQREYIDHEEVIANSELFLAYVEAEIESLEKQMNKLIVELKGE